jgi:hypothetical protein
MGNYHPTIKKLFEDTSDRPSVRKREKGLGMGVGRFQRGMLRLSREEINSVRIPMMNAAHKQGRGRGKKR